MKLRVTLDEPLDGAMNQLLLRHERKKEKESRIEWNSPITQQVAIKSIVANFFSLCENTEVIPGKYLFFTRVPTSLSWSSDGPCLLAFESLHRSISPKWDASGLHCISKDFLVDLFCTVHKEFVFRPMVASLIVSTFRCLQIIYALVYSGLLFPRNSNDRDILGVNLSVFPHPSFGFKY